MFYQVLIHLNLIIGLIFCSSEPKVAIIGAGVSGLSTANRFLEKGFQNFEVFEAENRSGGRVFPVKYKDGYLQMGAQFINEIGYNEKKTIEIYLSMKR
uniref:Amine oxidase domain-containing protein n=1 Tax=Panagrolaimus superbus TaxID=310955 RepID=A0A914YB82_9BILA